MGRGTGKKKEKSARKASEGTVYPAGIHRMYLKMSVSLKNAFGRLGDNRKLYKQAVFISAGLCPPLFFRETPLNKAQVMETI